ncbi:MAG: hypothetical protein AABZ53_13580 [Planctomycetota bacterium]
MNLSHVLPAIVLVAAMAPAAVATDRYYRDSFAISPNGKFRIDAKSPDNAGARPRPFASNFTYTLTDTTTKKVVWERKQPMSREKGSSYVRSTEGSPMGVFVNDDGVVAAHLSWETLLILDAADGSKRGEADVLKAFPKSEQDKYVSHSTAGPHWSQESDWFFVTLPAKGKGAAALYFVIRPYWNHRLVIDASTGKHVDLGVHHDVASPDALAEAKEDTRRLLTASIEEETRRAVATLNAAPESLKDDKDYKVYWELTAALHTVGFLKLTQCEARLTLIDKYLGEHASDTGSRVRAKVREALRSMGKTPLAGCGVQLYPLVSHQGVFMTQDTAHPFNAQVPVDARQAGASQIASGMTMKELTDLIGCPDAELYDGARCYDYDIDGPEAYTLRVYVDRGEASVQSVKKITPFAFLHDPARMREH